MQNIDCRAKILACTEHFIMVSITIVIVAIILWLCTDPGESLKCSQTCHVPTG